MRGTRSVRSSPHNVVRGHGPKTGRRRPARTTGRTALAVILLLLAGCTNSRGQSDPSPPSARHSTPGLRSHPTAAVRPCEVNAFFSVPPGDPLPRTVRLPDPLTMPPGAVVAGVRLGRGEAVHYVLGPEGACDIYLGADGASRIGLGPADGSAGIWEVFSPGGAAMQATYGCAYIPEVARLAPGAECSKPRGTEVRPIPTGVRGLYASLVWAKRPGSGDLWGRGDAEDSETTARYGTVALFLSRQSTYSGHRYSEGLSISCSLPDRQDDICTASLGLFLTQTEQAPAMGTGDRRRVVRAIHSFVGQHRS